MTMKRAPVPRRPLQHLQIAVGVADSEDRSPADELGDADGLARAVVDEVDLGQPLQRRLVAGELVFELDARPDDLFGRDAVGRLDPGAHELQPAAGHDIGLEAVRPEIGEQLDHRLVDELVVGPVELRMPCVRHPLPDDPLELGAVHAGMGRHEEFFDPLDAGGGDSLQIPGKQRLEGLLRLPFRLAGRQRLDPVDQEHALEVVRLLRPERSVIVEGRDALCHRNEVRAAFLGDLLDEGLDRLLGAALVPGWKRIGLRRDGADAEGKPHGHESGCGKGFPSRDGHWR